MNHLKVPESWYIGAASPKLKLSLSENGLPWVLVAIHNRQLNRPLARNQSCLCLARVLNPSLSLQSLTLWIFIHVPHRPGLTNKIGKKNSMQFCENYQRASSSQCNFENFLPSPSLVFGEISNMVYEWFSIAEVYPWPFYTMSRILCGFAADQKCFYAGGQKN